MFPVKILELEGKGKRGNQRESKLCSSYPRLGQGGVFRPQTVLLSLQPRWKDYEDLSTSREAAAVGSVHQLLFPDRAGQGMAGLGGCIMSTLVFTTLLTLSQLHLTVFLKSFGVTEFSQLRHSSLPYTSEASLFFLGIGDKDEVPLTLWCR